MSTFQLRRKSKTRRSPDDESPLAQERAVSTSTGTAGDGGGARDAVVTGMGFCLPGPLEPVFTPGEVWHIASRGGTCLVRDEIYYGAVNLSPAMFEERLPEIPSFFSRHYTTAHRFG